MRASRLLLARPPFSLLVLVASMLVSAVAGAWPGNVANSMGYITSAVLGSGSAGDSSPADDGGGCIVCHGQNGAGPSNITIDDVPLPAGGTPANFSVRQGETKRFTLEFTVGGDKVGGGFLIMHDDLSAEDQNGTLGNVDDSVHVCRGHEGSGTITCTDTLGHNSEVTHEVPKDADASGGVSFEFTYTANATSVCKVFQFGVWVNAVDHDTLCFNATDFAEFRRFQITTNCDDGNACTNDACGATACGHSNNSNACTDPDPCTTNDRCNNGICAGAPVVCTALDLCHVAGTCSGGVCSNPVKANGATCTDGNPCTVGDTCQNGGCLGGPVVGCPAPDQCHGPGSCNKSTGACSYPNKPNGTTCNDGKVCTTPDTCTSGACSGPARVCDDGIACTVDSCSEAAGGCTSSPNGCKCAKDADCDDGNACNGKETCNLTTLSCRSGASVDCSSRTNACSTGTCAPATGTCSAVPKANGTPCDDGDACTLSDACQSGTCRGTPVVCAAPDQCHDAGTCKGGVCSNPPNADGAPCNDKNACTTGDSCMAGACKSGPPAACADDSECTIDGCSPATGCTFTPGNAGVVCSPPTCSGGKETRAASCNGSAPECPGGVVNDCAPYVCGAAQCSRSCMTQAECSKGNYCTASGACKPKRLTGTKCRLDEECLSGFCHGGVCIEPAQPDASVDAGAVPQDAVVSAGGTASGGDAPAGVSGGGASPSGTGGRAGTGGAPANVDAGLPAYSDSGKASGHTNGRDTGGCGCRVQSSARGEAGNIAGALAGLLVVLARRRRRQVGFAVLALALAAIGAVAGIALRAPPPATAPSPAAGRSPAPPPVATEPRPFPHAIRYACTELAPPRESPDTGEKSPAATLQRETRWYGVSAVDCADGLALDAPGFEKVRSAVSALLSAPAKDLSVLGRALTQNAALRVARCARPKASGANPVVAASIEGLRRSSLRLVQRLALGDAELSSLRELVRPAAEKWLGPGFDERAVDGPRDSVGIHARSSALTLASRALPTDADGVATLYGDLVLINDEGLVRTAGVPGYVLRRRTSEAGLAVCFGALSENGETGAPEERPIALPEGPLELRGVTCDRCHVGGRRLSEPLPQPRSDRALLDEVARWYEAATRGSAR